MLNSVGIRFENSPVNLSWKNNLKTSQIVCIPIIPQGLVLVDMKWASDWKEAVQTMSNESSNEFVQIHVL